METRLTAYIDAPGAGVAQRGRQHHTTAAGSRHRGQQGPARAAPCREANALAIRVLGTHTPNLQPPTLPRAADEFANPTRWIRLSGHPSM